MLAYPSKDITRKIVRKAEIVTIGEWGRCEVCFQAKAKRHAMPKTTDE